MFSFFYGTLSPPFDICPAFEKIRPLLSSLFAKETELKKAAKPGSITSRKYRVISDLCEDIRQLQHDFDQASKESSADTVKQLILIFANKLGTIINDILTDYGHMLNQHRDVIKRAVGRKAIDVGTHAAMIAPGALIGSPVIAASMAVGSVTGTTSFITTPIRQNLYYATGLTGKKTKSVEILNSLALAIKEIVQDSKLEPNHTINEELFRKDSAIRLNNK